MEHDSLTYDTCCQLEGAEIQHGPNSSRVYLMSMKRADPEHLPRVMAQLASENNYGKLIAKVRESQANSFIRKGFKEEARLPGYYLSPWGKHEDALLLAYYLDNKREQDKAVETHQDVLTKALTNIKKQADNTSDKAVTTAEKLATTDAEEMSALYRQIFPSYPFPIHNTKYIQQTMAEHVDYYGIRLQGKLIALASAEKDLDSLAVEMTDFATHPAHRGQALASQLLNMMESTISDEGFHLAYTIARSTSIGMNRTFAKHGYQYTGRLINNTQISGKIESMNVWFKSLIN